MLTLLCWACMGVVPAAAAPTPTEVKGGSSPAKAPELTAGYYTDVARASGGGEVLQYYKIKRAWKGSTIRVSSVAFLAPGEIGSDTASWSYALLTSTDQSCDSDTVSPYTNDGITHIVTRTMVALPLDPRVSSPDTDGEGCATSEELLFVLGRGSGTGGETPVQIRVIEEPPVENAGDLPSGVSTVPEDNASELDSPAKGEPQQVTGGKDFDGAVELKPGTYSTEVQPGQMVLFKTPIAYGQSAVFALDSLRVSAETRSRAGSLTSLEAVSNVYAPDFSIMDSNARSRSFSYTLVGEEAKAKNPNRNEVPPVRFRNRWDSPTMADSRGFAMAGYYYYALGVESEEELAKDPVTMEFSFAVNGDPSASPSTTVNPNEVNNPGAVEPGFAIPKWALYVGGGILVMLGGTGVVVGLIGRRVA